MSANSQVGVADKYFYAVNIAQRGVDLADEPLGKGFVAMQGSAIVTKEVNTEVLEVLAGDSYVAEYMFAGLSLSATK